MKKVSVLIPTIDRSTALAVTLTALALQSFRDFDVLISDQGKKDVSRQEAVRAVARLLRWRGHRVSFSRNLPRRGMAQQRQFLLDKARSPYVLFLDDDVILEPFVLANLAKAIGEEQCGFVGSAVAGLSYTEDFRPHEQAVELWRGRVRPERVIPHGRKWQRHKLHNAANLLHLEKRLGVKPERPKKYKVAWIGGCVLYDAEKLKASGGFGFWRDLPKDHCGEDTMAQLRVLKKYGGCGLIPSGAYHQELPTTLPNRKTNAPEYFGLL